ncbi:HAD-IA family hydrolase (plasmid) [Rhizobium sp. NIBRBAC000502774]|nr:HAD-IA family hydrolase [Rhizobium sp. NIBRBAC000502774]
MPLAIFDLDGTLLDTAPDIYSAAVSFSVNHRFPKPAFDEIKNLIGGGVRNMLQHLLKKQEVLLDDAAIAQLLHDFTDRYENSTSLTKPYPGVIEALDHLTLDGYRLGICTNKPTLMTERLLERSNIKDRFQVIIGPDRAPAKKPDPRHLQAVCSAMGRGTAVFIGDSAIDAETAERANIPFIFFEGGYLKPSERRELAKAAAFINYHDLPSVIATVLDSSH